MLLARGLWGGTGILLFRSFMPPPDPFSFGVLALVLRFGSVSSLTLRCVPLSYRPLTQGLMAVSLIESFGPEAFAAAFT
jgi:hypothetical protein